MMKFQIRGSCGIGRRCFITANSTIYKQTCQKRFFSDSGGISSSVSQKELDQFRQFSSEWWKPGGEYDALRSLNHLRVPIVKQLLLKEKINKVKPLECCSIVDVGCGGGILAEPLSRLGANVLGIDPLPENIDSAKYHASLDQELSTLQYECSSVEDLCYHGNHAVDMVVTSEVLEHVDNPENFICSCCQLVKPGGHILITTINRTLLSTLLVKYAAEYILRIVPQNTHDENKFIQPDELTDMLRKSNMVGINYKGMIMNPLTLQWSWTNSLAMNYMCYARKSL